jgi:hypothetical protein
LKIRHALVTAGIVSALVAAPAFAQADNTNSRWSPSVFDAWMQRDQSYNSGSDSIYYYSAEPDLYYYRDESGWRWVNPRRPTLAAGRMDPDLVYGPTPNQVHPGNSLSNPTGTELQGQNSGGK